MRRIHGVDGLLLVTPLALAARCGFEPVRILEPVSGSVLTCMPFTVVLDLAPEVDTQTIELQFDGLESFGEVWLEEVTEGGSRIRATADFVWAPGLDCSSPGIQPHELVASAALGSGLRTFRSRSFDTEGDAYADDAPSFSIGNGGGFNQGLLPGIVTGAPVGGGLFAASLDVVSLGQSGSIDLAFTDNVIVDGPGVDFTVFENAFLELGVGFTTLPPFSEPGRVSVSQDGVLWFSFPCSLDIVDAPYYPGCAGVYSTLANGDADPPHPAVPTFGPPIEDLVGLNALTMAIPEGSGGDSFDLADVGLSWARWVRIDGANFVDGPVGPNNFGFDLDAAAAVNSVPATDLDMNGIPDAVE
jgi:hypothetical protein